MYHPDSISSETVQFDEPVDLLRAIRRSGAAPLFYWERPDRGLTIAAAVRLQSFEHRAPADSAMSRSAPASFYPR